MRNTLIEAIVKECRRGEFSNFRQLLKGFSDVNLIILANDLGIDTDKILEVYTDPDSGQTFPAAVRS